MLSQLSQILGHEKMKIIPRAKIGSHRALQGTQVTHRSQKTTTLYLF